ncbi:hypothetical protein PHYSODRAFT_508222 [Phytophthora sojae]|uniref:Expansin-like EG45 domain-containing protein n=1 Tax=Phytophthora sojae (strain P6497) TaxID=1094619 RepID=G4ZKU6_PHYSP|nr:hypothetical protein PHYSODRAFT_508222 [Phytophthora sojae]EGZ14542.1 hypothetical protein PHYSODRAFT_508222 [Phytophthora sojae]|eukprot:XP_009528291.1 hypothetical protein PHYSODRAFT_508222 [Phytophthora sojae]
MFRQIALLSVALPAMALAGGDTYFAGEGTSYTLGQVSAGNCNFMYDPGVGDYYAALNSEQWDSTLNCGRCAEVSCADSRCSDTSSTVTVFIVDKCPECSQGDLDLSPTVFKQLTGSDPSRYSIRWKFVDCPVSGNVQYCTKSGSSSSWLAVQPANFANGVASMKIANQDVTMVDSCYYFLLNGGSNVDMSAVDIELTSISGETITETLSLTADKCTDGTASQSQTQQQSDVNSFDTLKSGSLGSYTAGKVTAANESSSGVSILQSSAAGVEKTPTSQEENGESDSTAQKAGSDDTKQANTKTEATSGGTSPVIVALVVLAVVGGIVLAAVAYVTKKKKLDDKRIDRDEAAIRSFDTFSSPVRINSTIAQI